MTNKKKSKAKAVNQYTKDGVFVATYESMKQAAQETGISHGNICSACRGRLFTAGGFIWQYADAEKSE